MSVETFVVQLQEPLTPKRVDAFTRAVVERGGRVELMATKGSFVISIDNIFFNELRTMPIVKMVGGVGIQQRNVPVILKRVSGETQTLNTP